MGCGLEPICPKILGVNDIIGMILCRLEKFFPWRLGRS
jgi:hypothetical protein